MPSGTQAVLEGPAAPGCWYRAEEQRGPAGGREPSANTRDRRRGWRQRALRGKDTALGRARAQGWGTHAQPGPPEPLAELLPLRGGGGIQGVGRGSACQPCEAARDHPLKVGPVVMHVTRVGLKLTFLDKKQPSALEPEQSIKSRYIHLALHRPKPLQR